MENKPAPQSKKIKFLSHFLCLLWKNWGLNVLMILWLVLETFSRTAVEKVHKRTAVSAFEAKGWRRSLGFCILAFCSIPLPVVSLLIQRSAWVTRRRRGGCGSECSCVFTSVCRGRDGGRRGVRFMNVSNAVSALGGERLSSGSRMLRKWFHACLRHRKGQVRCSRVCVLCRVNAGNASESTKPISGHRYGDWLPWWRVPLPLCGCGGSLVSRQTASSRPKWLAQLQCFHFLLHHFVPGGKLVLINQCGLVFK